MICYIDSMIEEMDTAFTKEPQRKVRIGTGEFTDSLAIDRLTQFSKTLVEYIGDKK